MDLFLGLVAAFFLSFFLFFFKLLSNFFYFKKFFILITLFYCYFFFLSFFIIFKFLIFLIFFYFLFLITLFYLFSILPSFLPSFLSFSFLLRRVADRVFMLRPGLRSVPLRWESRVQDTSPPETSRLHIISNGERSPRDLHLNTKTQLYSMTSKLQCWTPYDN